MYGRLFAADTTAAVNASGAVLEIGDSTQNDAFVMPGVLSVGSSDVRLRSRNQTALQRVSLAGGILRVRPGGASVPIQRTLSGGGTLDARIVNSGSIVASTPGITFLDTLVCTFGALSGTKFTFAPGSIYIGSASILSDVVDIQAGSTIQASIGVTIGKNAATTAVTIGGRLLLAQNAVVNVQHRVSAAPCELGTLSRLGGGNAFLLRSGGFALSPGDSLTGLGTVSGPFTNGGVVGPGVDDLPGTPNLGTLNINGVYTQGAGGRLIVQIGDAPTNQFDKLAVTGAATLGGTLDVRLPPGFAPSPGEQFTVMTFASRTGVFSAVTFQGYPPGAALTVTYNPTSVVVTAGTIPVSPRSLARRARVHGRVG